ncbi:MAG: hypothetical protein H6581_03030 [Bacteroidia bacterium]|nr:hypothetical protein [Bacteroidia bacterium]
MNSFELKGGLYDMISRINDKDLLAQIHGIISKLINQNLEKTEFWDELPADQQNELELAIQESYNKENLVSHEDAMKEIQAWLTKE